MNFEVPVRKKRIDGLTLNPVTGKYLSLMSVFLSHFLSVSTSHCLCQEERVEKRVRVRVV